MTHDDKTLYAADGSPIPLLPKDYTNYLDKTSLIFGGSGSGKTTVVEEILFLLKDHIPNYLVIAPRTSDTAYRRKLPARCIKEDFSKERIQKFWKRQFYATQVYNIANDFHVLESLFNLAPVRESVVMLEAMKRRATCIIQTIDASTTLDFAQKKLQKSTIEELYLKKVKTVYRDAIRKNTLYIRKNNTLSLHQETALEFLDLNPRICLIIDDCSEKFPMWMKLFKKTEINPIESIFYKGRWNFITLIFAAHDDKLVNTELRKNSRVTIYTTSQAFVTSMGRVGNGYSPQEKRDASKYVTRVFGSDEKDMKTHQKLCYVREDSHPFKYLIANLYPDFTLGCSPVRAMVCKMPKKEDDIADNPYAKSIIKKSDKFEY